MIFYGRKKYRFNVESIYTFGREDSLYLNNDGNWDEEKFLVGEIKTFRLTF